MSIARLTVSINRLRRFRDDHGGGVAVAFALSLTVMIGFGGAATEVGSWLLTRRAMQGAADAAAVSALNAIAHGGPDYITQAKGVAAQNGWTDGVNGVTVTATKPPTVGNFTGNAQAVEVIIAQAQPLFFSALLPGVTAPTIKARGVAAPNPAPGTGCLLALGTGNNSVTAIGNGSFTLSGCDIVANGNVNLSGNASISAYSKDIGGTVSLGGNASVTLSNGSGTQNDTTVKTDSLSTGPTKRTFARPAGNCQAFTGTFVAGHAYCSVSIGSNSTVSMPSGVYYIEGGDFTMNGNATLTSQSGGVTIIMTGTNAAPTAAGRVNIDGNANVTLTALLPGPGVTTAGVIFFQDPAATGGKTDIIQGNGTLNFTGALDFSKDTLSIGGNGSLSTGNCLHVVALTINLMGNGTLANNCSSFGVDPISSGSGGAIRLVE
jgi:Flp pilus assembly protein TadG